MYHSFYGLREKPFSINTDPKFLWLGEKHQEALANLKFGLIEANGYVVLTGDVGTGKTTIVNALIDTLDNHVLVATINHPTLNTLEFLNLLAKAYGLPAEITSKTEFLSLFSSFLQTSKEEGKVVLLVIDEAHRLSIELLEEIRLLSNIGQAGTSLINIFFVGQNELKQVLFSTECRALRQRITLFYEIETLLEDEVRAYMDHRLRIAGCETNMFTPGAIHRIQSFTQGHPRLINTLCHHALLTGFLKEIKKIDTDIIVEVAKDMRVLDPTTSPTGVTRSQNSFGYGKHLILKLRNKTKYSENQKPRDKTIPYNWYLVGTVGILALITVAVGLTTLIQSLDRDNVSVSLNNAEVANEPGALVAQDLQVKQLPSEPTRKTENTQAQAEAPKGEGAHNTEIDSVELPSQEERASITIHSSESQALPDKTRPPKTLEVRASEALKQNDFQLAIDLLEAEGNLENESLVASREIYIQALVGRAEQVLLTSPDESENLLLKTVEMDPDNIAAYLNLGKLYTKAENYTSAIDAYQHAVRLNPNLSKALFNLGFIYATIGNYTDAEKIFTRVVELEPSYLDKALFNLALVQEKLGKKEECVENLRLAMTISPDNKKVQSYLNQLVGVTKDNDL